MATVNVEVDLDEFSNKEIFEEFNQRISNLKQEHLRESVIKSLNTIVNSFNTFFIKNKLLIETNTLEDYLKNKLINEAIKKYSLTELEEKLK